MNKKTSEVLGMVEDYLREAVNMPAENKPTPEEIGLHITRLVYSQNCILQVIAS